MNVFDLLIPKLGKLVKQRFEEPTLAQEKVFKKIIDDENVLVIAPTGIGKTEAVMLPIFNKLLEKKHKPISILYLTPMRSLNRNMLDRLYWWCDKLDLEVAVRHGDTTQAERSAQREIPPHLLVTTPETLGAILPGKVMREHLKNVKYVIVDEIHELIESKRGVQLSVILERLEKLSGPFQRIGLSATVGSPERVADFLSRKTRIVVAEAKKNYELKVELPLPTDRDKKIADELFVGESTTARLHRIRELINKHQSVLTFTNTRETAEVISSRFRAIDKELRQEVHHGSLSKEARIKSEKDFKEQKLKALICTSSLELGIDIGSIDFVIQYLSPRQVSRLIQRIGRSGHGVGRVSSGILLTDEEDAFESTVIARKALNSELEEIKVHEMALDVLAHQTVGMVLDEYELSANSVFETVKKSYPFRNMEKEKFHELLKFLSQLRLLWVNPVYREGTLEILDYKLRRNRQGWQYYYENLSTIADVRRIRVVSIVEGEPIGYLDESFAAE
ncbi:MAG: DEAD/DEAH box helicase, partial [Candidatus Aenigmarchaeota archaeon]|nr:DEAD/DEAH box helicase [Candidatus Aenigmarchaeota archaeon]